MGHTKKFCPKLFGGAEIPTWLLRGFREAIMDCDLVYIPLEGYQYTWVLGDRVMDATEERLDPAMVSIEEFNSDDIWPQSNLVKALWAAA